MQEQDVQITAEMDAPALTLIERLEIERKRQVEIGDTGLQFRVSIFFC